MEENSYVKAGTKVIGTAEVYPYKLVGTKGKVWGNIGSWVKKNLGKFIMVGGLVGILGMVRF